MNERVTFKTNCGHQFISKSIKRLNANISPIKTQGLELTFFMFPTGD